MASGTPDASQASVAAVTEALRAGEMHVPSSGGRYGEVAPALARTPRVREEAKEASVRRAPN